MFDLKRPCNNCPFRRGVGETFGFGQGRLQEIAEAVAFQCHKTVDYSENEPLPGNRPQQCAGLMAILAREHQPNQIMQVAMRLGYLDPSEIDPDGEAYGSLHEAIAAHIQR